MTNNISSQTIKIGVVTVTYNSRNVLEDFFASLAAQTYANLSLYFVDSGSTDNTVSYILENQHKLPQKLSLLRNEENIGFAAGTNQGIRAAFEDGCTAILALNNDTVFGPELINILAGALDQYRCGMTAPIMYYHEPNNKIWAAGGRLQPWLAYRNKHRGFNEVDRGQFNVSGKITFAPLCCVLIKREVFDRVGLLDEAYFTYTEDVDFMLRCLKSNVALWYVPEAKLWHKVSSCTGGSESDFTIRYCTRNRAYFWKKNLPAIISCFFVFCYKLYFRALWLMGVDSKFTWRLKNKSLRDGCKLKFPSSAKP